MLKLFAPLAIASLLTTTAFAADTGTLTLSGTVALVNSITVSASGNTSLNIVSGSTNTSVGSVSETSNNPLGYKITASSANAGQLVNTADNSKKTGYTFSYNNASAISLGNNATIVKTVNSLSGQVTNSSPVKVNVQAFSSAPAGTYSDTITLAIVANN